MALNAWIVDDKQGGYFIQVANFRPTNAIALSPLDNGEQIRDIDWLDIADVDDGFGNLVKTPVLNATKKAAKLASEQTDRDAFQAKLDAVENKKALVKALDISSMNTIAELRDALVKIVDVMGLT